jgi:TP901 family phage tail tape measure protein
MASEYKGLHVKFEGDSTELTAALSEINAASRRSQSALRSVQNALKLDPGSTKLLAAAMVEARGKVEATTRRVRTLRQAQEDLAKSGDTTSAAYRRVSRELAQAEAYLKRDQRALVDATYAASGFGRASAHLEGFSRSAKAVGEGLSSVGGRLTMGVTVPLAAVATACVSSAVTIDTALTDVRKTTSLTEAQYQSLKRSAVELSTTQPVSAAAILSLEGLGAQLGWSDDKLQSFAQTVSGLDIATDMGAEQAATNLAQFANITGMAQDKAENYASAIVGLGNNMATTESKISDMAMGMASAATQAGMSQADILGVAAAAASLGLEAQAGGSAFSKTINEIGVAVSTSSPKLQQWADLAHMSAEQFRVAWQTDAIGAFEAVIRGMSEVSATGGDLNVTLADLGITELRQSDFLRRMAGNSDLVSKAVRLSNDEWTKNTALQNEAGNRNQSLASKMEVLKNRVTAVAEEMGGPLADAALSAVDAAKPITDTVEGAAKAFSSMSKEEQQAAIRTVAMVAAAGPLLSVAGKAISVTGSVAGGLSTVVKGIGTFVGAARETDAVAKAAYQSTGGLAGKLGTLGWSAKGTAADVGTLSGGLTAAGARTALLAGGIGLAVAAMAVLGKDIYDAIQDQRDLDAAIGGMRGSAEAASAAMQGGARSVTDWGGAATGSSMSTRELTQAIRDHADAMSAISGPAEETIGLLGQYQSVIDRMAGRGEASAEDAALLDWALKGLNDTLGTSYTAMDVLTGSYEDQSGAIHDTAAAIDELVAKKQAEARVNAYQEMYTEAVKNEAEMQRNATTAKREYDEEYQRQITYAREHAEVLHGKTAEEYAAANAEALHGKAVRESSDALDGAKEEVSDVAAAMAAESAAATDAGRAMAGFLSATDGWASALADVGLSMDEVAGACAAAGVSTETLSAMGADAFARLAASAGGDVGSLIRQLTTLDELGIDPKTFTVGDDGTITDESGMVWDLDAQTIDGKHFEVNDDGTISIAERGIDHVSARSIRDKWFTISARDDATSVINSVTARAESLAARIFTTTISATLGNAAGGVVAHATGGVRTHADGAVYTGPTMIDGRNLIGEAGPEYYDGAHIVPLTSRYGQPFADLIAEGVELRIGSSYTELAAEVRALHDDLGRIIEAHAPSMTLRETRRALAHG